MKTLAYLVFAYAILIFLGGILGCFIAGSIPSLLAGILFGILIALNGLKMIQGNIKGQQLVLLQSIVLGSFFVYRYQVTHKAMPSILMIVLSFLLAIILLFRMPKRKASQ